VINICTTSLTFNNCELCPHSFYLFCIYLRTNSDLCHLEHNLLVFYNIGLTFYIPVVTICTTSLTWNNCTPCPHCDYLSCIYLRTNSELCNLLHKLIGFCNRGEKCLQRGTDWVFKWSGLAWWYKKIDIWNHWIADRPVEHRVKATPNRTIVSHIQYALAVYICIYISLQ